MDDYLKTDMTEFGACVTILCFRIHQLNKEEQTEKQKEDNGDGADQ